ncbi:hypothetical protein AB0E69_38160 [Kribbella sp. NPDC026611]|uniref:hypothetical protein n=1 Tax=Kribbella sp. NPDC026611 TaxID=3154911 RepID=UPI003409A8A4
MQIRVWMGAISDRGRRTEAAAMSEQAEHGAAHRQKNTPGWTVTARPMIDVAGRILCLVLGAALLVAGLVGLFTGATEGELLIVLAAGLLLLVMPSIVDRLVKLRAGQFEVELIRQIAVNARKTAEALRRLGLADQLDAYATIYTELRDPELKGIRGEVLDRIVQRVSNAAAVEKFDKAEVRELFLNGSPIVRVLALGLMQGDLSLVDGDVLQEAIDRSLTGNEQYHALKVVRDGWGRLSDTQRNQLVNAIKTNARIERGPARREVAKEILGLGVSPRIP